MPSSSRRTLQSTTTSRCAAYATAPRAPRWGSATVLGVAPTPLRPMPHLLGGAGIAVLAGRCCPIDVEHAADTGARVCCLCTEFLLVLDLRLHLYFLGRSPFSEPPHCEDRPANCIAGMHWFAYTACSAACCGPLPNAPCPKHSCIRSHVLLRVLHVQRTAICLWLSGTFCSAAWVQ